MSYAYKPDKTVGALRTTYWAEELPKVLPCEISVITANKEAVGDNIHIVPNRMKRNRIDFVKDAGITWKKEIKRYLNDVVIKKPDLIIISGSPFMHFSISRYFKQKFSSVVILDYRDPFADNANFNSSKFKIAVKRFYECKFNAMADGLITVNSFCGRRICKFEAKPHAFVKNGYDERIRPSLKEVNVCDPVFVYTGKFYFDPVNIIAAIEEVNGQLFYAGSEVIKSHKNAETIHSIGFVDYGKAVQLVADGDIAIIQTIGDDSIATTKIFDYIRCKKIILVVSKDKLQGKGIAAELNGYPYVFWSSNDKQEIKDVIGQIKKITYKGVEDAFIQRFSRKEQLNTLANFIRELC